MRTLKLGTRGSALALWQAERVAEALKETSATETQIVIIKTTGDKVQNKSLTEIGGEGLFTEELTAALRSGEIDFAVHSFKDVPVENPADLLFFPVLEREDPADVLVAKKAGSLRELPENAKIGTSSLRRAAQLRRLLPKAEIKTLRGNVPTRLEKLQKEDLDAIVLAYAGVKRLGFEDAITEILPSDLLMPAVGQGMLAVEVMAENREVEMLLRTLTKEEDACGGLAERAFLKEMQGGCKLPVAALTERTDEGACLIGRVISEDGSRLFEGKIRLAAGSAEENGKALAKELLRSGASEILEKIRQGLAKKDHLT